jgi:hypothetical protein
MPSASLFLDEPASDVLMAPTELYGAGRRSMRPTPVLWVSQGWFGPPSGSSTPSPTLMIAFWISLKKT